VLNGNKGIVSGMTGPTPAKESDLVELREKVFLFLESQFSSNPAYKLELSGIEEVEGKPAYKIKVKGPTGAEVMDFYDTTSKLKVRSIVTRMMDGQKTVQTVDLGDYKKVGEVLYPHMLLIAGDGLPMAIKMEAESVEVNGAIDQSVFNVE
jgi:zinc protease